MTEMMDRVWAGHTLNSTKLKCAELLEFNKQDVVSCGKSILKDHLSKLSQMNNVGTVGGVHNNGSE